MAKQLKITPEIEYLIKNSIDDQEVDTSKFAVFEAKMLSTEPIQQKGFHSGARVAPSTLHEMAEFVNTQGTNVPLQTMHEKQMLPIGRVFHAFVKENAVGELELYGMFYIPQDDGVQTDLINKIENSLIDEVSVGLLSKKAVCSECDFDYLGPEGDFINIMTLTCENGHTIGQDGTHVRLIGMDTFAELSLVGQGAAKNAKILSRAKSSQSLSEKTVERLAASKIPAEAHVLTASFKLDSSINNLEGNNSMELNTLLAKTNEELGGVKAELSQAKQTIEGLNSEKTELEASIAEKDSQIAELQASTGEGIEELKASKEEAENKINEISEMVSAELKAAMIASGEKEEDIPEDIMAMLSMVKDKGIKLYQLFAGSQVSDDTPTDVDLKQNKDTHRHANFKING